MMGAGSVLDVKGLACPLPILRTKKALKLIPINGTLTVLATDPGSVEDMKLFCQQTGNELLESLAEGGVFTYVIRRTSQF